MTRVERLLADLTAELARRGHGSKGVLAADLGVGRQRISAWLHGTHVPSAEHALAIAEWLQAPPHRPQD